MRRHFREKLDYPMMIVAIVSALYGLLLITSAVKSSDSKTNIIIQSVAIVAGIILMIFFFSIDYEVLLALNKVIFAGYVLLLILVLLIGTGRAETGTEGWFRIGPISIQPAEFAKIGFIITFSHHLSKVQEKINRPTTLFLLLLHLAVPLVLIMLQPDYGTSMVFIFIALIMLFYAGLHIRYFVIAGGLFAISTPVIWHFLSEFQKNRILVFLNPGLNPSGSGYNVLQSKLAVGAGELFGKGLFQGTQVQLGYLPGKHTDFIFAVAGEELGFIGCMIIICLLGFLIYRMIKGANQVRTLPGSLICIGTAGMFIFQTFENIGMTIGLMPVTGIPLPFFSYGGSSILTSFIAVGLVLGVLYRKERI